MDLGGPAKMWHMRATPEALQRLGTLVASRRAELRLERRPAARLANISNTTWQKVENGESVRDVTYAAIESVLRWEHGSCATVLAGGEPKIAEADADERTPLYESDTYAVYEHVVADDLRDAVRGATIATLPGVTGSQIRAMERRVEEELRRRLLRRTGE